MTYVPVYFTCCEFLAVRRACLHLCMSALDKAIFPTQNVNVYMFPSPVAITTLLNKAKAAKAT
jgi:hypothetical protein